MSRQDDPLSGRQGWPEIVNLMGVTPDVTGELTADRTLVDAVRESAESRCLDPFGSDATRALLGAAIGNVSQLRCRGGLPPDAHPEVVEAYSNLSRLRIELQHPPEPELDLADPMVYLESRRWWPPAAGAAAVWTLLVASKLAGWDDLSGVSWTVVLLLGGVVAAIILAQALGMINNSARSR